jgi:GT2 family glycosyltransferase
MEHRPHVSIVVPTYGNPEALADTLASLRELDYPNDDFEIIVVEDRGDGPERREHGSGPRIRYVAPPQAGAAAARNHGARLAEGDVLILIDDDMIVPKHLIRSHLESLEEHAPAAISGYRVFAPGLAAQLSKSPFGRFRLSVEPIQEWGDDYDQRARAGRIERFTAFGMLTANDLAVRRDDFWRVGGFDEAFPNAGYEDQEFALRAERAGIRCLVNWGLVAWHNDRRLTLGDFLNRQRRGALNAVIAATKYPERYMSEPLLRENMPIDSSDQIRTAGKKAIKVVLSSAFGRRLLFRLIGRLEQTSPNSRLLTRLYKLATGIYIFLGVRDGWRIYGRS